ncbi:MAG: TonB-dependent receptor [Cyclobacteriaceae bacterium]
MSRLLIIYGLIVGFIFHSYGQNIVSGYVKDADTNEPLIGSTVLVKGTSSGTITNIDGSFDLNLTSDTLTLFISYTGYKPQEIPAVGNNIEVLLEVDLEQLDEVVVIGYGVQKKSDLTGSLSSIKSDQLKQSNSADAFSAMQGRVSGVQISTDSGQPGAGMNIVIRGQTSVNGTSSPLFVIDGVQLDVNFDEIAGSGSSQARTNPLASLNPADIESIEILKDASATAIFGSRGANGVVIVTTKSGSSGSSQLVYSFNFTISEATKTLDVASAQDYLKYQEERGNTAFLMTDADGDGAYNDLRNFDSLTYHDWQNEALRKALTIQHQLTLRGGNNGSNYSIGLGYLSQQGLIINNSYDRYNFRLRLENKFSEKLRFWFNSNATYSGISGVANNGGIDDYNGVTQFVVLSNPWDIRDENLDQYSSEFTSPIDLIKKTDKQNNMFRIFSSANLNYSITKNLKYNALVAGMYSHSKLQEFFSSETSWGNYWDGRALISEVGSYSYNHSSQFHYNKTFTSAHKINAMAAFEINHYNWEKFNNDISGFEDQSTGVNDISKGAVTNAYSSNRWRTNRLSYLGRVNYSLLDKYLFTGSIRADGSDKFGPGNRWGYFSSGAFAWRVSDEDFMKEIDKISNLKLRISYGATGNERIPAYTYMAQMENSYYASDNVTYFGMSPSSRENQDLKWEVTHQYNLGLDLGLFNNRLNVTIDYYQKITKDLLMNAPVAAQSGYNNQWLNIGRIDNSGLELQISTINIDKKDFEWRSDFNISFNRNEVKALGGSEFITVNTPGGWITNPARVMVGQPIGTMYGYLFDGIYQIDDFTWQNNSDPTIAHEDRVYTTKDDVVQFQSGTPAPGAMKYKDISGPDGVPDGIVDDEYDRTIIGRSNPVHFGGLNNTFSYKDLDLSIFFQWSYGNDVFNAGKLRLNGILPWMNISQDYFDNHWTPENGGNVSPGIGQIDISTPSSYFVEDASYLRLKTVSLGYNIPTKLYSGIGISTIKVSLVGTNLLTWTNYSGMDPEVNFYNPLISGFDRIAYPRSKSITFNLDVKF